MTPTSAPTPAPTSEAGSALKINFAPDGSQAPEGYISDAGQAFGERDNGHAYGWMNTSQRKPTDHRRFLFERGSRRSPDRRHDTLAQLPGRAMLAWELKLDNGTYRIRAVLGDPNSDAHLGLKLEGRPASLRPSKTAARWAEVESTVEVKDGRLTLESNSSDPRNALCFIEVWKVRSDGDAPMKKASPAPTEP